MKRIKHWALTLGVAGSLLLGMALPRTAVALSDAEVRSRLKAVPVFTLGDDKGQPIVVTVPDEQNKEKQEVLVFFINHEDALQQLSLLKKERPEEAKKTGLQLWSMKDVLETFDKLEDQSKLLFFFQPSPSQLKTAVDLLKTEGLLVDKDGKLVTKDGQPFNSDVPLFYATMKGEDGTPQPLTTSVEKEVDGKKQTQAVVPFYLNKADLDRDLQALKKQPDQPEVEVRVWMLNYFISQLTKAEKAEDAPFELIPSDASAQFGNSLLQKAVKEKQGQGAPAEQAAPEEQAK